MLTAINEDGTSPKISEVLPLLYLHGLSSGDFMPALEQFLGSSAGLSPTTITRLTAQWQADHKAFMDRDLSATDYVYVWADSVHLRIRLEEAKAAALAMVFKLIESAQERWRAVNAPHLVALVRAGAHFERPEVHAA